MDYLYDSLYAVLICIFLSKNGLIAFLSIEHSKESKSRREELKLY